MFPVWSLVRSRSTMATVDRPEVALHGVREKESIRGYEPHRDNQPGAAPRARPEGRDGLDVRDTSGGSARPPSPTAALRRMDDIPYVQEGSWWQWNPSRRSQAVSQLVMSSLLPECDLVQPQEVMVAVAEWLVTGVFNSKKVSKGHCGDPSTSNVKVKFPMEPVGFRKGTRFESSPRQKTQTWRPGPRARRPRRSQIDI
jgi:hypothetical protein